MPLKTPRFDSENIRGTASLEEHRNRQASSEVPYNAPSSYTPGLGLRRVADVWDLIGERLRHPLTVLNLSNRVWIRRCLLS